MQLPRDSIRESIDAHIPGPDAPPGDKDKGGVVEME